MDQHHDLFELVDICAEAGVACGPVYSSAEIARDPQIAARGSIISVPDAETGRPVAMASPAGRFSGFTAEVRSAGPQIGEHTDEVLSELLGHSAEQIQKLRDNGAV